MLTVPDSPPRPMFRAETETSKARLRAVGEASFGSAHDPGPLPAEPVIRRWSGWGAHRRISGRREGAAGGGGAAPAGKHDPDCPAQQRVARSHRTATTRHRKIAAF